MGDPYMRHETYTLVPRGEVQDAASMLFRDGTQSVPPAFTPQSRGLPPLWMKPEERTKRLPPLSPLVVRTPITGMSRQSRRMSRQQSRGAPPSTTGSRLGSRSVTGG